MRRRGAFEDDIITEAVLESDYDNVIERVNAVPGPKVAWDSERGCHGLKADRHYGRGEIVTTYGGRRSIREIAGDYVARCSEEYVDARIDFRLSQKGRWINESDRDRTHVNVRLGRTIRATRTITEGEWLFTDYGNDYARTY